MARAYAYADDDTSYRAMVSRQIESGALVCPQTKKRLNFSRPGYLVTEDGSKTYLLMNDSVPMLVVDKDVVEKYSKESEVMNREYTADHQEKQRSLFNRIRGNDYRTKESILALDSVVQNLPRDAVAISIGGGPVRVNKALLNLNIGPFPNVDLVCDAHRNCSPRPGERVAGSFG